MYDLSRFDKKFGKYIEIRPAISTDIDNIYQAQNIAFRDDPTNMTCEEIEHALGNKNSSILVGFFKEDFAGYVMMHNKKYRPWENGNGLVVLDLYAGKCIAAYLMRDAISNCKKPFLRLFVEKGNAGAIRIYEKFGFINIWTHKNHYENGNDALVMIKPVFYDR